MGRQRLVPAQVLVAGAVVIDDERPGRRAHAEPLTRPFDLVGVTGFEPATSSSRTRGSEVAERIGRGRTAGRGRRRSRRAAAVAVLRWLPDRAGLVRYRHTCRMLRMVARRVGPVIDSNVHLWDQGRNPVFWLEDRTMLRDMLGDYDSLPDTYALADYNDATSGFDVRGVVWSDAGAIDPVAAAEWVTAQNTDGRVIGLVALGDPTDPGFERLVSALRANALVTSVRVRLVPAFQPDAPAAPADADGRLTDGLRLLADQGWSPRSRQGERDRTGGGPRTPLPPAAGGPRPFRLARRPLRRRVPRPPGVAATGGRRAESWQLAMQSAIFRAWDTDTLRPWLHGVVEAFGAERCMLGSDLPIETLRSPLATCTPRTTPSSTRIPRTTGGSCSATRRSASTASACQLEGTRHPLGHEQNTACSRSASSIRGHRVGRIIRIGRGFASCPRPPSYRETAPLIVHAGSPVASRRPHASPTARRPGTVPLPSVAGSRCWWGRRNSARRSRAVTSPLE